MRIERSIDWFEEVMGRPGYTEHVMSAAASDVADGLAATLMPGHSYEVRVGEETVHDDRRLTYSYTRWVDIAEMVRCRDCRHCHGMDGGPVGECGLHERLTVADGFCAWAKRKEVDA